MRFATIHLKPLSTFIPFTCWGNRLSPTAKSTQPTPSAKRNALARQSLHTATHTPHHPTTTPPPVPKYWCSLPVALDEVLRPNEAQPQAVDILAPLQRVIEHREVLDRQMPHAHPEGLSRPATVIVCTRTLWQARVGLLLAPKPYFRLLYRRQKTSTTAVRPLAKAASVA